MEMKQIILSGGEVKLMSYEDILKQFDRMLNKFAYQAVEKIIYNKPEVEEVLQELRIQTWIAFKRYNGKNAFSTYLVPRLQHGVHKATQKLYAKKRISGRLSSIDEVVKGSENDASLGDLLGEEDIDMLSCEFRQFIEKLEKTLEPSERLMIKSLMAKDEFSIRDLADELGMSRQGANKKYNKFREKMAKILRESGYVAC